MRFDGQNEAFSGSLVRPGLIRAQNVDRLTIQDCFFTNSQRAGIDLNGCASFISRNEFANCRTGIFANNSVGLTIDGNYLRDSKDNGIMVWRDTQAFDASVITNNRVYTVANDTGGSGQFGNGIFVFLANSVTASGNAIINCNDSAIRYSSSSNAIIKGNQIENSRECAIFVEAPDETKPAYEGACIEGNTIYNAGEGIKVVNANPGSRRATVTGNAIRSVTTKTFDEWVTPTKNTADRYTRITNACAVIGNADIVVANNVIEACSLAGAVLDIRGSWNSQTGTVRDQNTVSGMARDNIIKDCPIGIGYNDYDARGFIDITDNILSGATNASVTLVNVTNLPGVPGQPNNGFGPYAREPGAPDVGANNDPITDRTSITRNKIVPKTDGPAPQAKAKIRLAFHPNDRSGTISIGPAGNVLKNQAQSTGGSASVRSTLSRWAGSGLVAFQATINSVSQTLAIGLANPQFNLTSGGLGSGQTSIGFYVAQESGGQAPQSIYFNGAAITSGSVESTNGSVVSCVVNFTTKKIWFSTPEMRAGGANWNNNAAADPSAGIGGASFAAMQGPYHVVFNTIHAGGMVTLSGDRVTLNPFLSAYLQAHIEIPAWDDAPGKDDSLFKRPMQAGAIWEENPSNPAIVSLRQLDSNIPVYKGTAINSGSNWGQPIYISDASGKLVTITDGVTSIQFHVPIGAKPAVGDDAHMNFFDLSKAPLMVSCFQAQINNAINAGVSNSTTTITCTDVQIDNAYGIVGTDRITGQPGKNAGIGVIRNWHLAQAVADPSFVIPNMLRWIGGQSQLYWNLAWTDHTDTTKFSPTTGFPSIMWPLAAVDGYAPSGGYTGQCPSGATIGIPNSLSRPAGKSRGFYLLFDTLQQFGAVWEDASGLPGIALSAEYIDAVNNPLFQEMAAELPNVVAYLCILKNQVGLSTMKGGPGGGNLYPAAPSLDTASYGGSETGGWLPSGFNG